MRCDGAMKKQMMTFSLETGLLGLCMGQEWDKGRGLIRRLTVIAVPMNSNSGTRRKRQIVRSPWKKQLIGFGRWWGMKKDMS